MLSAEQKEWDRAFQSVKKQLTSRNGVASLAELPLQDWLELHDLQGLSRSGYAMLYYGIEPTQEGLDKIKSFYEDNATIQDRLTSMRLPETGSLTNEQFIADVMAAVYPTQHEITAEAVVTLEKQTNAAGRRIGVDLGAGCLLVWKNSEGVERVIGIHSGRTDWAGGSSLATNGVVEEKASILETMQREFAEEFADARHSYDNPQQQIYKQILDAMAAPVAMDIEHAVLGTGFPDFIQHMAYDICFNKGKPSEYEQVLEVAAIETNSPADDKAMQDYLDGVAKLMQQRHVVYADVCTLLFNPKASPQEKLAAFQHFFKEFPDIINHIPEASQAHFFTEFNKMKSSSPIWSDYISTGGVVMLEPRKEINRLQDASRFLTELGAELVKKATAENIGSLITLCRPVINFASEISEYDGLTVLDTADKRMVQLQRVGSLKRETKPELERQKKAYELDSNAEGKRAMEKELTVVKMETKAADPGGMSAVAPYQAYLFWQKNGGDVAQGVEPSTTAAGNQQMHRHG